MTEILPGCIAWFFFAVQGCIFRCQGAQSGSNGRRAEIFYQKGKWGGAPHKPPPRMNPGYTKIKRQKLDNNSIKATFELNISIQSPSQNVWVSPSYEKNKLDENWKTHSVIIIKNQ